jgi:hypothetical protein
VLGYDVDRRGGRLLVNEKDRDSNSSSHSAQATERFTINRNAFTCCLCRLGFRMFSRSGKPGGAGSVRTYNLLVVGVAENARVVLKRPGINRELAARQRSCQNRWFVKVW